MSTHGGVERAVDKGVRILSLDSGGPGTYSQLLIIKEYMVRLAHDLGVEESDVYPADYFDLMGGVGFGGLVAILLGHLRMDVDEAIGALLAVAFHIFPSGGNTPLDPETNTRGLSEALKNILRTRGIPPEQKMKEKGGKSVGCKVVLYAAASANPRHPVALRTYKSRGNSPDPTILEAICATMVIPSYFSSIKIGPHARQQAFVGGPLGANNPTRELLKEATAIFGKDRVVAQIVSVGCGSSRVTSMDEYTSAEGAGRLVGEMGADCEMVAKEIWTRLSETDAYLRLDVDKGMEGILMEKWNDLGLIGSHTSAYVASASDLLDASLRRLQESAGTVTLGQINQPSAAKDVQQSLGKYQEGLDNISKSVRDNEDSRLLDRLKPADAPSYQEDHSCMEGTRKLILEDIFNWAERLFDEKHSSMGSTPHNIFWLYGSPGLGKTSVANSLCHRLHKTGRLGGSFFCRRDDPILCDPNRVFPTLLYRLAWVWKPYRDLVARALRDDTHLNPDSTGCELLLKLLHSLPLRPPFPLVLVLDALDECGEPQTRKPLLKWMLETCARVDWLKVIVTSRPEHDISSFFQKLGPFVHDLATDPQAPQDIRTFARIRMASLANEYHLPADWPGDIRLEQVATRSGGLFIFVETLYRFLKDPDPELLLAKVLGGTLEGANTELHKLYSTAIESQIGRNREHFKLFIQAVVAVATYRSLPDKTLASLIGLESRVISSWVDKLSSLLYRDASTNGGIRARHLSVIEFLTGPTCPQEFQVHLQQANAQLGRFCLVIMIKELKFNICELETSCQLNSDIQDLEDRVQEKISDALQYSSMHWSSHLCGGSAPTTTEVSELLNKFLLGTLLLNWMEVLSVMRQVPFAILALRRMKARFKKLHERRIDIVDDALRFLLTFYTPISTSTPHLYISALPFTPTESFLWKYVSNSFPKLLNVTNGRLRCWTARPTAWVGHASVVFSVAYSPDGRHVVSGSHDQTIRIWDAETGVAVGEPLRGHTHWITSVAYSPDGRHVVSGSHDETIRIWDAETGVAVGEPLRVHTHSITSVAYSPDGRHVVSGSGDQTIRIWDAETGVAVGEPLRGHTHSITSVAYSPDGRHVVSGSRDQTIRIWDAETGVAVGEPLRGHTDSITSVAYSPDGRHVVSGSGDQTIRIWDAETGVAVGEPLRGHTNWITSVAYSPDGRHVVSGSQDQTIRIWDAETGVAVGEPLRGHTSSITSVAYSPDGRHVVSGSWDQTIRIWDAETGVAVGEPLRGHTNWITSVAYSPDGRHVASGSHDKTIRIWDAETGVAVGEPLRGHTDSITSVAYSPDGRHVVSGSGDQTIRIWDAETGVAVGEPLRGHTNWITSVAYSPDGRHVVSGSQDQTIRIWDAETGVAVGEPLRGHTSSITSVAYSPDGRHVVSGSWDQTIRIWDAETGVAVGEPLRGHTNWITSVAYSPDGRHVASGSHDKTIRIWDAETGVAVGEPLRGHTDSITSVAYSPDGRHVVSGSHDQTIRIWDAETGVAVGEPLRGHTSSITSVAYSPDGRHVVSGSDDQTIRIWDAETGVAVGEPLRGHTSSITSVAYSPDGRHVVSGSADETKRIWNTDIGAEGGEPLMRHIPPLETVLPLRSATSMPRDRQSPIGDERNLAPENCPPLIGFSGMSFSSGVRFDLQLDLDGWVRHGEDLLFWVPEDCRNGLTCPAIVSMPNTGHRRPVRVDFTHFLYGNSWTDAYEGQ